MYLQYSTLYVNQDLLFKLFYKIASKQQTFPSAFTLDRLNNFSQHFFPLFPQDFL